MKPPSGLATSTINSPIGQLHLAATGRGLVQVGFGLKTAPNAVTGRQFKNEVRDNLDITQSANLDDADATLKTAENEIVDYFDGTLKTWSTPIDWSLTAGFRRDVLKTLHKVPYGKTTSYGQLAARAGNPKAARAVGSAMATNPLPIVIPCHRVLRADESIGSYGGGVKAKETLLKLEGAI